ncbi:protein transport protein Sec31A isoform X7 [Alosa sapidissima]|uniref:protein transport protein Sec31A isoform X7 n=1 Tax=Alosa sapidissima TaxID=34773 RepID=UPI001C0993A2|nr:protein transport protein Sec31A isoform X7 [Alosa sapidissima]
MKLKEINRTAIQAWSPAQQHPVYLATGTSAQQLDASFSTSASLEIFQLDLTDPTLDMKTSGTFSSPHRYHQLAWGPHGIGSDGHPSGVLIAGGENGNIILYDPAKILDGSSDVVIDQSTKHTGPVRALDVNPFQTNLFASGGNESEIYIWDLNSFSSPMTPGPKSQPLEDVSCVAWNGQVQHILASASPSGRASIWDLRKNDLIIKVSDHSNRMHCSGLAWHPEVATQLALASEDDRMPVIQMWDLRFATSPLKVLENHTRGVLAIAWSLADPELLLSCGKDNRILCWDPNTAEVLYELPTSSQWCFDIQWCPRNPALLSAAAFDGHISVYSIMGGKNDAVSLKQADQISTSFGNLDPFGTGQTLPPLQLPQAPTAPSTVTPLKKPPKWIRRPVGASFAFGGKLVSLENGNPLPQPTQQPLPRVVHVSQVVTETAFLERSGQLQATLSAGSFAEFCQTKIEAAPSEFEKAVWSFLKVNFEDDSRGKYLELLGYKKEELALKIAEALEKKDSQPAEWEPEEEVELQLEEDMLPEPEPVAVVEPEMEEEKEEKEEEEEAADDLIEEPLEDPTEDISTGPAEPAREPEVAVEPPAPAPSVSEPVKLKVSKEVDGLITQALLTGDFESAVDLCLHDNRMADSIILAIAGGPELLERTQKKYFLKTQTKITKLISAVVMRDWLDILQTCELHSWREALAAVMTYAKPEDFSNLCGLLGSRLEQAEDLSLQAQACLCYICAGSVEKLVTCWTKAQESQCPLSLQDLVEKVVILRQAVERTHGAQASTMGTMLAQKMGQYASLLASQGSLDTALAYLPENSNQEVVERLRDRLSRALGHQAAPVTATPQAPSAHPAPTNMPTARPAAAPAYAYNQQHSAQPVPAPAPAHTAPQYYQQFRSASTVTSWSNQTPTVLPSAPRPLGPAPEPQVDPSVPPFGLQAPVSAAPPASSAPGYMHSQQYPQIFPHYNAGAAAPPALYNPLQYSSSPPSGGAAYPPSSSAPYPHHYMPSAAPYPPSPATAYPSHPHHHHPPPLPHSLPSPPAASVAPSFPSPPPVASSSFAPSSPPPLMGGSTFQQGGLGSPVSNVPPALLPPGASGTETHASGDTQVPASQRTGSMSQDENDLAEGPQNGWNDPPNLTRGPKKKKVLDNYAPPAPITAPIMSPLGEPQPQAPTGPPQPYPQPGLQAPYAPMQHHPPQGVAPAPGPPSVPLMNLQGAPGAPTGDRIQPMQKLPAEKVSKKPIPQEHMMLKTTFEGLVQKCLAAASDPQTKRKLDVANKRLEMLYDKLREQSLSPAIVGGLHNMARSIESRAYTDGLNIHTHIVSSSNFSEISAFMPVLKVLLTEAIKLGV